MKLSPKKQQGMTLISMACVAIVVVSMFLLALNIVPIYMEHGKITGALESIKQNPEARNELPDQLSTRFFKLLSINNVSAVTRENVIISRDDSGTTKINVKYEVVKKIVANASILVEFDDTVDIR
jgi:Tfp pilus assembly major pilin PilA